MPSGRTHDRLTYLAALPAAWAAYAYAGSPGHALITAAGVLFGGLMFGPDLDVKSVQYYRWGPLRWIWWPYQRMFRHRSVWTHGVLVSLVVRLAYFALVVGVLAAIAYALVATYLPAFAAQGPLPSAMPHLARADHAAIAMGLGGIWLGGALHTWADVVVSGAKRMVRGRRRRR